MKTNEGFKSTIAKGLAGVALTTALSGNPIKGQTTDKNVNNIGQNINKSINVSKLEINPTTKLYTIEGIVNIDSTSKDVLYEKIYNWIISVKFANSLGKKGVDLNDKLGGKISISQYFIGEKMPYGFNKVRYKLSISIKDNKFKCVFDNFYLVTFADGKIDFENILGKGYTEKDLNEFKNKVEEYVNTTIEELTNYITQSTYQNDDIW